MTDVCPSCGSSLQGPPIPVEYRSAGWYGTQTHFSRAIGIEYPGVYDGVLVWLCPDCEHRWPRFAEGPLYGVALRKIEEGLFSE